MTGADRGAPLAGCPRVLCLLTGVAANGGIQRFNRTLLAACVRLGVEADVLCLSDDATRVERSARDAGLAVAGMRFRGFAGRRVQFSLHAARALTMGRYTHALVGHVNFAKLVAGLKALWPLHTPPALLVAHGVEVWTGVQGLRRRALQSMQQILCVSRFTRDSIREQAPELPEQQFALFPNALGEGWVARYETLEQRAAPMTLPGRFVLSVSRLDRHERPKGIVTVLEALARLGDESLHYLVAGAGDDVDALRGEAERLGLARQVRFLGAVSDEDLVALYRRCEVFALPSGKEGFGIVFLEAMFFGAPVIAARARGAVDVVRHEQTGLLVEYGDAVQLESALRRLLNDSSLRERLRAQARASVTGGGEFTFEAFARRWAAVLEQPARTSAAATSAARSATPQAAAGTSSDASSPR